MSNPLCSMCVLVSRERRNEFIVLQEQQIVNVARGEKKRYDIFIMRIWNVYVDSARAPKYIKRLVTAFVWNTLLYPLYMLSQFAPRRANIWVCGIPKKFVWNSKYVFLYANNAKLQGIKVVWISRSKEIAAELREKGYPAYYWLSWQGIVYPLIAK